MNSNNEISLTRCFYNKKYHIKRFKQVVFDMHDNEIQILVEWKGYPARCDMTWENPITLQKDLGFEDYYDLLWPHKAVDLAVRQGSPPRVKRELECPPAPRKKRVTRCRCGFHASAEDSDNDDNMPPR